MGIDTRWTKSGNMIFDDNAEIVGVIKDDVIEFDSSKIGGGGGIDPEIEEKIAGLCEYSTEETDTGKEWIDGKRIFRRVISQTSSTNANIVVNLENASSIVMIHGLIVDSGITKMLPIKPDQYREAKIEFDNSTKDLTIVDNNKNYLANKPVTVIVEYTKEI